MATVLEMHTTLQRKLRVQFAVCFDTAWRIGSGKEGETLSDLGVVLDAFGQPVLPGSSLKGRLRSTCETLAHALNLSACMLDHTVSHVGCSSDVKYYRKIRESYRHASRTGISERLEWIEKNTCDVCKLFGSPVMAGRVQISDGMLEQWSDIVQVRDGVVIDRDSQTAVDRLKYDYEVVPPGSRFRVTIVIENYTDADTALLGAAIFEWSSGSTVGGFTSRGLGRFHLEDITVRGVDLSDAKQRIQFLTKRTAEERLSDLGNWEEFFATKIEKLATNEAN